MKVLNISNVLRKYWVSNFSSKEAIIKDNTSVNNSRLSILANLSNRVKIAGAFFVMILLGLAALSVQSSLASTSKSQPGAPNSMDLQVDQNTNIPNLTAPNTDSSSATDISSNTSTSNANSNGSNPAISTSVTVNGQQVNVPTNGSTQKTVNSPNGKTSINVSSTSQGNNDNSSFHSTSLNVSTTTNSSTEENDSQ